MRVKIGLEHLLETPSLAKDWGRCGLLVNQGSVDAEIRPSQVLLKKLLGERLTILFTPQHGLCAEKQDDMIESGHSVDFVSGLPFFSLYSQVREPTNEMVRDLDTVIVDIQDVGTRVYTFIYTMAGIMRACARQNKSVVVLDRPNPIGGVEVEGNVLDEASKSFVGEYELPMRHGLTIGEVARWMNAFGHANVNLDIIPMVGWKRSMHYAETGRLWIMTSPNIPTAETCELYPGMVLLEGTNMSEGRGTTLPFLMIGAPYLQQVNEWMDRIKMICNLGGIAVRPTVFEPTFHKWAKQSCWGVQFVVMNPQKVRSYSIGLAVIVAAASIAPEEFQYKDPPYEYEWTRPPMQLLLGSKSLPQRLLEIARKGLNPSALYDLEQEWQAALKEFKREKEEILIYREV